MSASQGCTDDKAVVNSFKEALLGRVGTDRYQMWFAHGVEFSVTDSDAGEGAICRRLLVRVRGQFALDRLRAHFLPEIRGAARQACGGPIEVQLSLDEPLQTDLPLDLDAEDDCGDREPEASKGRAPAGARRKHRGKAKNASLIAEGAGASSDEMQAGSRPQQLPLLDLEDNAGAAGHGDRSTSLVKATSSTAMTAGNFVPGVSNRLAHTAMVMVCQDPRAASPLYISGPTGTGKTHMMSAIAQQLRQRHRMRRVMHLSAEQFTNDFISSVGNSGITAFRRRYRDVDALLIDDVQFLGSKKATLREMLYTVETLAGAGRPLVFTGLHAPTEIKDLSSELAGRMAAGLVCQIGPLDLETRETILRRWLADRCPLEVPEEVTQQLSAMLAGDGRVISGVVNMINTLQRMYGRMPTMDELRHHGGGLLRGAKPVATLSVIESAVCETFQLSPDTLRGRSQIRSVTQPRMLAMYLARQMTSAAYSEIARHFGGKSHSTAISAENNVKSWLADGKAIGRGNSAMSTKEAIDRVESLLRSG